MQIVSIIDPNDRGFPFSQDVFEDRTVLYHGTWSTYIPLIESSGLRSGAVTFDSSPFVSIAKALQAIGVGSFFAGFHDGSNKPFASREIFLSASFWGARAYATDAGGEILRMTLKDAKNFERICLVPEERARLVERWEIALRSAPEHEPTVKAVAVLKNDDRMRNLYASVTESRRQLLALSEGGHAVVYAVRVEPSWFGDSWESYIRKWEEMDCAGTELKYRSAEIPPNCLIGRVDYLNGTDSNFLPNHITTWREAESLRRMS